MLKSKTFWTCIAAIIAAVGGYFTNEINMQAAVGAIILALIHIFQRQATEQVAATVTQVAKVQTLTEPVAAKMAAADTKVVDAGGVGKINPPDKPDAISP